MKKCAQIYLRFGQLYFSPSSQTTTGLWIETPPLFCVRADDFAAVKGEAVLNSLAESRTGVPVPRDDEDLTAPLLEKAKARSWADFMRKAKCIGVELSEGRLGIMPFRKLRRPAGALEGITESVVVLGAEASQEQIGQAIDEALRRCQ